MYSIKVSVDGCLSPQYGLVSAWAVTHPRQLGVINP